MELKLRCKRYINELGAQVTSFCRRISISPSAYYRWQKNEIDFSEATRKRIDGFISKYGF